MRSIQNFLFVAILLASSVWLLQRVSVVQTRSRHGVTTFDNSKQYAGVNLYNSTRKPYAAILDMQGRELHRWQVPQTVPDKGWHHVEPLKHGEILAVATDRALLKLNWKSNVLWKTHGRFHHDVVATPDGTLFSLTRKVRLIKWQGFEFPILDDYIAKISRDGILLSELSLYELIGDQVPGSLLQAAYEYSVVDKQDVSPDTPADIFHTNSIDVLINDIPEIASAGALLLSLRELNEIIIVNPALKEVLWNSMPGTLQGQHDASFLTNGSILVFDNGVRRHKSRVLEIDPVTHDLRQIYGDLPQQKFFSGIRGGAQRLPNGNHLITHAVRDVAFEIDRQNEQVWRIALRKKAKQERAKKVKHMLYRMRRMSYDDQLFSRKDGSSLIKRAVGY